MTSFPNYGTFNTSTHACSFRTKAVDLALADIEQDRTTSPDFEEHVQNAIEEIEGARETAFPGINLKANDRVAIYKYDVLRNKLAEIDAPGTKEATSSYRAMFNRVLTCTKSTSDVLAKQVLKDWEYYDVTVIQKLDWITRKPLQDDMGG